MFEDLPAREGVYSYLVAGPGLRVSEFEMQVRAMEPPDRAEVLKRAAVPHRTAARDRCIPHRILQNPWKHILKVQRSGSDLENKGGMISGVESGPPLSFPFFSFSQQAR